MSFNTPIQVGEDLAIASKLRNARVATLYGGVPYEPQVKLLKKGLEVVVGTPGRLIDLYNQGALNLKQVKIVVLDEADEMLHDNDKGNFDNSTRL